MSGTHIAIPWPRGPPYEGGPWTTEISRIQRTVLLACCGPGPWGPQRASLRLARPGPLPVPRPLAALRGHSRYARWPWGPSAWSLGLSRGPLWPRPRHAALGLGPPGAAARPSPGSASPRRRAAARPWAPPRLRPGVALRGVRLAVWGPPCGALRAALRSPLALSGWALRPSAPPAGSPWLRPAGRGCAPSGLLPPGGCAPWRALLPPAPGRGGFAACGRRANCG